LIKIKNKKKKKKIEKILQNKQLELDAVKLEYQNTKILMKSFVNDCGECSDIETYTVISQQKHELKKKKNSISASIKQFKIQELDLTNKIEGIESRIIGVEDKQCPICKINAEGPCITPCCRNVFCLECLTMAITISKEKECPLCRAVIDMKKVNLIVNNSNKSNNKVKTGEELPNKIDKLIEVIMSNPTKRFMVFSEFDGGISKIKIEMNNANIKYSGIKGSTASIDKKIAAFRNKEFNVLLLNAKFFGAGLNLQFTDEIIIFHRMAKDLEKQVIGRAQRIGRTDPLKITYLCYENEYNST